MALGKYKQKSIMYSHGHILVEGNIMLAVQKSRAGYINLFKSAHEITVLIT